MSNEVIVLNGNYNFLNFCSWKRALVLINSGKANALKLSNKIVKNVSNTFSFTIPYIIVLTKIIRKIYKRKIPWSKKNLFIRDGYICQYCGKKLKHPEVEHILPKSRGGKNTFENTVTSCKKCNRKKGNRLPSEAEMFLLSQPRQPLINEFLIKKLTTKIGAKEIIDDFFNKFAQ